MTEFFVSGPHEVPLYRGRNGRIVRQEEGSNFFRKHPSLARKRGCYVFAMRSGGGIKPAYVGKASKTFEQECFTAHKLGKCNQVLVDYGSGTLVLVFFVCAKGGKSPTIKIRLLEDFLI